MDWIAVLLGWPSLIAALVLAGIGSLYRRRALLILAAALILPVSLYLSAAPAMPMAGVVPVAALAITAVRCTTAPRWQSAIGVAVYALFLLWLAVIVFAE